MDNSNNNHNSYTDNDMAETVEVVNVYGKGWVRKYVDGKLIFDKKTPYKDLPFHVFGHNDVEQIAIKTLELKGNQCVINKDTLTEEQER